MRHGAGEATGVQVGVLHEDGSFRGIDTREPVLFPEDSFLAGVLWRPWALRGPLPRNEPARSLAIRTRDQSNDDVLDFCIAGVRDSYGKFHYFSGGYYAKVKSGSGDHCSAGVLWRPKCLDRNFPVEQPARDNIIRGLGRRLRARSRFRRIVLPMGNHHAPGIGVVCPDASMARRRASSPAPSASSSGTPWELVGGPQIDLPSAAGPANPSRGMRLLMEGAAEPTVCEICSEWFLGEPQPFKFPYCSGCGAAPSYHHGRCCPLRQNQDRGSGGSSAARRGRAAMASMPEGAASGAGGQTDSTSADGTSRPPGKGGNRPAPCMHRRTVGGANQFASWTKCRDCGVRLSTALKPPLEERRSVEQAPTFTDEAMYCDICMIWLNGQDQYDEHCRRKKHRTNSRLQKLTHRRVDYFFNMLPGLCAVGLFTLLAALVAGIAAVGGWMRCDQCLPGGSHGTVCFALLEGRLFGERLLCGLLVAACLAMAGASFLSQTSNE